MKNDRWKFSAEMFGVAAIVASLVFVGLQMRQAENIARYEFFSGADVPVDFVEVLQGHENTWLKGCADEELTDAEMLIFFRLASMHDFARNSRMNRIRLFNLNISTEYPAYSMALDLYSNQGLKNAWQLRADISQQNKGFVVGADTWISMVERQLAAIEENPPPNLTNGILCGAL